MPDWVEPVARYMLDPGLTGTLRIAVVALIGSAVIGILLGTLLDGRLPATASADPALRRVLGAGLPILVTVFIIYFALPAIGPAFKFDAFTSASIGLTLWGSAQVAEATRGAVGSIPREQHEASAALGFGWTGRHRYVILPQALRRLLPPFVSLLVNIIQNTTIAQIIGAAELLEAGELFVERLTFTSITTGQFESHALEIYGAVAAVFFLISFPLTRLAAYLERRLI